MNRSGNRRWNRAPWTLALLTTVCAELTFTAVAVPFTWLLVPLLRVSGPEPNTSNHSLLAVLRKLLAVA